MKPTLCRGALIFSIHTMMSTCPLEIFALWWDGQVPYMCYQSNEMSLLVFSADIVSVDNDFLTKQKILIPRAHISLMKRHDGKVMD